MNSSMIRPASWPHACQWQVIDPVALPNRSEKSNCGLKQSLQMRMPITPASFLAVKRMQMNKYLVRTLS